ncbi:unnamed protein product, partial [Timema podura]|nr:unnamed protein product [Timema podura]
MASYVLSKLSKSENARDLKFKTMVLPLFHSSVVLYFVWLDYHALTAVYTLLCRHRVILQSLYVLGLQYFTLWGQDVLLYTPDKKLPRTKRCLDYLKGVLFPSVVFPISVIYPISDSVVFKLHSYTPDCVRTLPTVPVHSRLCPYIPDCVRTIPTMSVHSRLCLNTPKIELALFSTRVVICRVKVMSINFWCFYNIDPTLWEDLGAFRDVIPLWLNHGLHTNIVVLCILEVALNPQLRYPDRKTGLLVPATIILLYATTRSVRSRVGVSLSGPPAVCLGNVLPRACLRFPNGDVLASVFRGNCVGPSSCSAAMGGFSLVIGLSIGSNSIIVGTFLSSLFDESSNGVDCPLRRFEELEGFELVNLEDDPARPDKAGDVGALK